jgi:anti-anti-sigma factor
VFGRTVTRKDARVGGFSAVPAADDRFVWIAGELDVWSADDFAASTASASAAGGAIVLELSRLSFIDSDGIRAILSLAQLLRGRGCLILHNPTPHVARVLSIVGLGRVPGVHLLDGAHEDVARADGPGAWSGAAAFADLVADVDRRMTRARRIGDRNGQLRTRATSLLCELGTLRAERPRRAASLSHRPATTGTV